MRFRAKMSAVLSIRQFSQVAQLLAKCSKQLVIRICSDKINFVVCERESRIRNNNGPTAHCELPQRSYFEEYAMEGFSPDANEIFLEIPSDALSGVMTSIKSSAVSSLKIKLTKKNVPCLTLEVELGNTGTGQLCTHDIPVDIVKKEDWGDYKDPDLPNFDVSFGMPELRILQRSLDRMKNMSNKLILSASKCGQLYLSIETISVRSTVKFKDLMKVCELEDAAPSQDQDTQAGSYAVTVDMKSLLLLVPQENMKPDSFICSVLHERLLHLYLTYGDITIQYFLPCSIM